MSHRGSLLCLPAGIWASPVESPDQIDERALGLVFTHAGSIDHLLIGTGTNIVALAPALRNKLREHQIVVETMSTGAAVRTYNILLGERRRVAALLIGVP
ncbi:MAG: Mth938-like domain-containing protein [Xanthobacteraceae bacterium]|nr:Mth938-like domain-containing protein [Xanthobacteraceae bacterium]